MLIPFLFCIRCEWGVFGYIVDCCLLPLFGVPCCGESNASPFNDFDSFGVIGVFGVFAANKAIPFFFLGDRKENISSPATSWPSSYSVVGFSCISYSHSESESVTLSSSLLNCVSLTLLFDFRVWAFNASVILT